MLRKSSALLCCSNLQFLQTPPTISKTSCHILDSRRQHQLRSYAVVSDGSYKRNHGNLHWPEEGSFSVIPTPYQIFNQKKGSPYSKQRFYELVKLYHPDRHDLSPSTNGVPYATKLERYRLVVAANGILSDPVKRSAFDLYGAGWNGMPEIGRAYTSQDPSAYDGRGWNGPKGPSQNATWEDWEKWYARDAHSPQEPKYVSNTAFVALVIMFAILGGIGQATRAGNYSMTLVEQRDALHDRASKDLIRRRREATSVFASRQDRIDEFLKQRNPSKYDGVNSRVEGCKQLSSDLDLRSSKDIKG